MVRTTPKYNIKNTVSKDESGVSAVIGVILMVAVTVILAAVIGAFVFQMYPNLLPNQSNQPFGITVNDDGSVTIINNGGVKASSIMVHANGFPAHGTGVDALFKTAPTDLEAPWTALDTVGGQVKIGDGTAKFFAGMTITVSGEINGNPVVLTTYSLPDDYVAYPGPQV